MKPLASTVLLFGAIGGIWFLNWQAAHRPAHQPLEPTIPAKTGADPQARADSLSPANDHLSRSLQVSGPAKSTLGFRNKSAGNKSAGNNQATTSVIVRGLLLGTDGQPCAGSIRVVRPRTSGRYLFTTRSQAKSDGKFQLRLRNGGPFRLLASGSTPTTSGNAMLDLLEFDSADPPQDLVLQLVGPGSLRGQVVDESGRPLPGLQVVIRTTEADPVPMEVEAQEKMDETYSMEGMGLHRGRQFTDSMGRFEFQGLRDDTFVIRTTTTAPLVPSVLLTPRPVPSNGDDLILVYQRPHLIVEVLDGAYGPVAVQSRKKDDWPNQATVLVLPQPKEIDGDSLGRVGSCTAVGPGKLAFDLSTGCDYMVYVLARGQETQSARISIDDNSGRVERVFVLNKPTPMGQLQVSVVDPSGVAVEDLLDLRILDPETKVCVLKRNRFRTRMGSPWPAVFALPVGDYTLEAISTSAHDGMHGNLVYRRAWGEFITNFAIEMGQSTEIVAQLSAPAWIDLQITGAPSSADRKAVLQRGSWLGNSEDDWEGLQRELDFYSTQAQVRLWRPSGTSVPVNFLQRGELRETDMLSLGGQCTSEALPAGNFRLMLSLPGGRRSSRDVLLVAGEVLKVEVDFGK